MSQANPRALNPRGSLADLSGFDESVPLDDSAATTAWLTYAGLTALLVVAYGNMLSFTSSFWAKDMYSHGYIVPLFAAYLFWIWRKPLVNAEPLDRWIGVAVVGVCLGIRVYSAYYDYNIPERLSFIGALLGVCLIVGGRWMLYWAGPALAFLIFMFPLPSILENTMLMKLQSWASMASTWTLQTMGLSAARQGNTISIDTLKEPLEVAEACSGLRMLTIFGAMSVAMALIIDRPWWDKLVMLVTAVPIALASNVIRIVTTALLFLTFGQQTPWLTQIIHDWAGFAMMPIGIGLLLIELAMLSRLTIPIDSDEFGAFGAAPA